MNWRLFIVPTKDIVPSIVVDTFGNVFNFVSLENLVPENSSIRDACVYKGVRTEKIRKSSTQIFGTVFKLAAPNLWIIIFCFCIQMVPNLRDSNLLNELWSLFRNMQYLYVSSIDELWKISTYIIVESWRGTWWKS